jgi:hypothetical protein
MARFTTRGQARDLRLGMRLAQDDAADGADEVDGCAGDDSAGVDDLIARATRR